MKIYTKTGDKGTTQLVSGERVSKASLRLESYGTIDELTAHIGYLHDIIGDTLVQGELLAILSRTMDCAALMATSDLTIVKLPRIENSHIEELERWTDAHLDGLPILKKFTLPAGSPMVSYAHICRTVARRAERSIVRVTDSGQEVDSQVAIYLNRLSDYLYSLSRKFSANELVWR